MTLHELRKLAGMNQTEFADYLNIPRRTLQNWDLGSRKPPAYVLELIHKNYPVLNIPVEILGYPSEPIAHGTISQIYQRYGLDSIQIADRIQKIIQGFKQNEN